jgi:hypothetical protein
MDPDAGREPCAPPGRRRKARLTSLPRRVRRYHQCVFALALLCLLAVQDAPVSITTDPAARQPQLAVNEAGDVFIAYGAGASIVIHRSTDGGKTFSPAVTVAEPKALYLGMRRGPRVAASGTSVAVSAIVGEQGRGRDGDLVVWHSTDAGRTWSTGTRINGAPDAAREGLHAMTAGRGGRMAVAWLDLRAKGTELWVSTSDDAGKTWNPEQSAYRSPSGTVCECCHPSAVFGPDGRLHLMFRNSLDGARDMYLVSEAERTARGSFGPATKLGTSTWKLNACPMDGGSFAIRPDGRLIATWRTEGRVLMGWEGAQEPLADGKNPWLALTSRGPVIVWSEGARIVLKRGEEVRTLSNRGNDPVVVAGPNGSAYVAWEEARAGIALRAL